MGQEEGEAQEDKRREGRRVWRKPVGALRWKSPGRREAAEWVRGDQSRKSQPSLRCPSRRRRRLLPGSWGRRKATSCALCCCSRTWLWGGREEGQVGIRLLSGQRRPQHQPGGQEQGGTGQEGATVRPTVQ